jgi:hypothetical protein
MGKSLVVSIFVQIHRPVSESYFFNTWHFVFVICMCLVQYIFDSSRALFNRWPSAKDGTMISGPDHFLNSTIESPEVFRLSNCERFRSARHC